MVLVLQGTVLSFYKFCEVIVWFELLRGTRGAEDGEGTPRRAYQVVCSRDHPRLQKVEIKSVPKHFSNSN